MDQLDRLLALRTISGLPQAQSAVLQQDSTAWPAWKVRQ